MTDSFDNKLATISAGAADWDSDLNANIGKLERGYHVTQRVGIAVNTGMALWCNSAGFFFPFDPNSLSIRPMAMAWTAAASGDEMTALAWGIVRSLAINSSVIPGAQAWVSAATPGLIVGSSAIQNYPVGLGLPGGSLIFSPLRGFVDGGGGGVTSIRSLTDVDPAGLANNSILKWSNATSKFTMQVDSTGGGGGGTAVGSPPSVVQFVGCQSGNSVTLPTTPTSGNLLIGIGTSPSLQSPGPGWTLLADNTTGTDFGKIFYKITSGATAVQTFYDASNATVGFGIWEVTGGKGVPPRIVIGLVNPQLGGFGGISPVVPNGTDLLSLSLLSHVSAANTIVSFSNVNCSFFANSGTGRQVVAGWSWADRAVAGVIASFVNSGTYKAGTVLITS